jgi:hypothetical protein
VSQRVSRPADVAIFGVPVTQRNLRNGVRLGVSALWPPNALLIARNALTLLRQAPWRGYVTEGAELPSGLDPLEDAALRWICRSQDRVGSGGVGDYTFHGWTPGYMEVTGYIIPTFWDYGRLLGRGDLGQRAIRMADWELERQLADGGVESLYEGEGEAPVVFNTAQVIRGLTRTYEETREARYLDAAVRAADWIVANQESDGSWTKANYLGMKRTYDAYAAAALAQLAAVTSEDRYARSAIANGEFVLRHQRENGWFDLCDNTPNGNATPSTHTLCYTVDGLLEIGSILDEQDFVSAAERAASALMEAVDSSGRLPGRFDRDWHPAASYVVATGSAQLGVILMKLFARTGAKRQLETALSLLDFLAFVQRLNGVDENRAGGLPGSFPIWGRYVPLKHPSWATKFYLDHLRLVRLWAEGAHVEDGLAGSGGRTGPRP